MDIGLNGKRVLVTAGAQGIGLAITEAFVAAGAQVHICDVDEGFLAQATRQLPQLCHSRTDVSDAAQVDAMFAGIAERWGRLDVLVNNAGIAGPTSAVEDTALADWEQTIAVNLTGPFLCTRRAVPLLKAAGGGSIVNLSSAAGRLGFPLRTPYSASKFGVIGLTESWAMELGPSRIRVNAILPGIVAGARQERVIAARAASYGIDHEAMRERLLSKVSLRSMVTAQDIANQIVFICSPAGATISGQSLSVCGNVEHLG
ncbi:SDR family oxidoreductase [Verminephrobacter eiseniae]|uniref:Short-chain dehydrogenase/reductase SDR n=1 Tax=Verminephrobacter eiseniae (strain EF01-2) TaxID=391735 RepID=A1WRZ2_VEREI|nr:SDR family oxidoreductase [Verminephrobacter eiseniae]ABM60399.1 short-chain dehydrogenase/reductase SDR [Verminephrobacter eiseniae EF01-2]MCW5285875.1 SDR family oxidoreductase [Verminephrobacter eiseniae]MCW5304173.1 SDR family oxidoreductase [Verminephrobacter eiseniae]MCW8181229.1 SDR family oxidoreductase [Verminephrobacter eiseniae]MCW8192099.1 SDR family oxidoreductase [Verminephrobacter eiseniae]